MIRVVAVTCDKWGSRIIRWGLGEPASHLLIHFTTKGVTCHSMLDSGVSFEPMRDVVGRYREVASVEMDAGVHEQAILDHMRALMFRVTYDVPAFTWFAWRAFLKKTANIPLPPRNAADRSGRLICVEVLAVFLDAWALATGRVMAPEVHWSTVSPIDCLNLLRLFPPFVSHPSPWPFGTA